VSAGVLKTIMISPGRYFNEECMEAAIELIDVTKTFGQTVAVKNLNVKISQGGIYGFIGPNGAGKTTTIRLIMSILFPDSGRLSVLGCASALEAKNRIGYLPEERGVYRKMRVGAFLGFLASLKGVSASGLNKRISASLERVGLGGTEQKKCEELSKGMLQKVQIIAATIHQPDLLILDEPFSGLDPVSTRLLRELILDEQRRGATILFSTHVMSQAEELCEHVIMVHQGQKVLDEKLSAIRNQFDPRTIEFEPLDPHADISTIAQLPGVEQVDRNESGYKVLLVEGVRPAEMMHRIIDSIMPARLELSRPRLEDIFIRLVSGATGSVEDKEKLRADLAKPGSREAF
jgi:ABC-2 type transport system ATP-binding protein